MKEYYFNQEHILFRKSLQDFLSKEITPNVDQWEEEGRVPKSVFKKLGEISFPLIAIFQNPGVSFLLF